jgi:hypothetical protein
MSGVRRGLISEIKRKIKRILSLLSSADFD